MEKGGRAQKYYSSIEWLLSADIITTASLVTDVMYDLFYKNETMKKEIDFLTQKDSAIIPIEVKSGNSAASSLNWLMDHRKISLAYKFHDGNVGTAENGIVTMPLYMAMFV